MRKKLCLLVSVMAISLLTACGRKNVDVDTKCEKLSAYIEISTTYADTEEATTELTTKAITEATTEEVVDSASDTDADKDSEAKDNKAGFDSEHYLTCTTYSAEEVEKFADKIKEQFEHKDLSGLSNYIVFPITIDGVTYRNNFDFVHNDFDKIFSKSFCDLVKNAETKNMYCSDIGIRLGDNGEVWINEVVNQGSNETMLKVIAIDVKN